MKRASAFLSVLLLAGGAAAQTTAIETVVFLEEGKVTAGQYDSFLERVNTFLEEKGVEGTIEVKEYRIFDGSENCVSQARLDENSVQADLAICAGSGYGGFHGMKKAVIGDNIAGSGATEFDSYQDVHATAHEVFHYLGFPDLYHFPLGQGMPPRWMDGDLMTVGLYRENPSVGDIERRMVNHNLDRLRKGGRKEVRFRRSLDRHVDFRKARIPGDTPITVSVDGADSCSFEEVRNGGDFSDVTSKAELSSRSAKFRMSDFSDNNGFRVSCGSKVYWAPFTRLDRCYAGNGYRQPDSCELTCDEPGDWCDLASVGGTYQVSVDVSQVESSGVLEFGGESIQVGGERRAVSFRTSLESGETVEAVYSSGGETVASKTVEVPELGQLESEGSLPVLEFSLAEDRGGDDGGGGEDGLSLELSQGWNLVSVPRSMPLEEAEIGCDLYRWEEPGGSIWESTGDGWNVKTTSDTLDPAEGYYVWSRSGGCELVF